MAPGQHIQRQTIAGASRLDPGAKLIALAGIGLVGYGIMFLNRDKGLA